MTSPQDGGELQFDSVVPRAADGAASAVAPAVSQCTLCHAPFDSEYFDVNGQHVCRACSQRVADLIVTPRDMRTLMLAGAFGVAAAILGAVVYFGVLAISGFEVGLVAIAIGYMVGYGVRMGARGHGGRRFQVLALVLTYWAIGLAYSSLAIQQVVAERPKAAADPVPGELNEGVAQPARPATQPPADDGNAGPSGGQFASSLLKLLAFTFVLPVLVIAGSLPGSLISAAIIVFGMMQAWKMTAAPVVAVSGPYRLGTMPAAG